MDLGLQGKTGLINGGSAGLCAAERPQTLTKRPFGGGIINLKEVIRS